MWGILPRVGKKDKRVGQTATLSWYRKKGQRETRGAEQAGGARGWGCVGCNRKRANVTESNDGGKERGRNTWRFETIQGDWAERATRGETSCQNGVEPVWEEEKTEKGRNGRTGEETKMSRNLRGKHRTANRNNERGKQGAVKRGSQSWRMWVMKWRDIFICDF